MVEGIRILNPQRSSHRERISDLRGLVKSVDLTPISRGTLSVNLNTAQDTFDICLGEFGKIGDSEEELADLVQKGHAIVSNLFILDHHQFPIESLLRQQFPIFYSDI